jgi:hypothetical protein
MGDGTDGTDRGEAHHADYYNQLGVIFLCKECHMSCHKLTTILRKDNGYSARLAAMMDAA